MHRKDSRLEGVSGLQIEFTDRSVSGWGGLSLPFEFFERAGIHDVLERALPDGRRSPNQIPVVDQVLSLFATILTGGRRFEHVERIRVDKVVTSIIGVERIPSGSTLVRYFGGVDRGQVEHLSESLNWLTSRMLTCPVEGEVVDLDSSVFERYGRQEGSQKGHNPRKHGRPSHHPLFAMAATSRKILHAWLRSGNTGSARGVEQFLDEVVAGLPCGFRIRAVRADSGFFQSSFLGSLERRGLSYAIAARSSNILRGFVRRIVEWKRFGDGLESGETLLELPTWGKPRRLIVVREELDRRPDARGRTLFDLPDYTFHFVVTDLSLPAEDVWRFYNGRADCENRLKEFKYDFAADGFCLGSFDGTEAVLRLNVFLHNLIVEFKQRVADRGVAQLGTLRHLFFVVGAILGRDGHREVLRLGLSGRLRQRFETWKRRLDAWASTTAAQLIQALQNTPAYDPKPWKLRPRRQPKNLQNAWYLNFN
jgi:hypothetical protein